MWKHAAGRRRNTWVGEREMAVEEMLPHLKMKNKSTTIKAGKTGLCDMDERILVRKGVREEVGCKVFIA